MRNVPARDSVSFPSHWILSKFTDTGGRLITAWVSPAWVLVLHSHLSLQCVLTFLITWWMQFHTCNLPYYYEEYKHLFSPRLCGTSKIAEAVWSRLQGCIGKEDDFPPLPTPPSMFYLYLFHSSWHAHWQIWGPWPRTKLLQGWAGDLAGTWWGWTALQMF